MKAHRGWLVLPLALLAGLWLHRREATPGGAAMRFTPDADSLDGFAGCMRWEAATTKRIAALAASIYQQTSGEHRWYSAGSGSANSAITFTERARITAWGEFLIGTATATGPKLEVSGTARATGGINTNSGTTSVANTTWTTLFTVPQTPAGKGIYLFMANYLDASDGQAFVTLLVDRTYVRIANQSDGATVKLRLSGQAVQAYHSYGSAVNINWSFLQIQIP